MKTASPPKIFLFSLLALLFLFLNFKNTEIQIPKSEIASPCQTDNTTFLSGEELTYKLYYNWNFIWLSAGEMTFRVIDEDDQYHFSVVGETYESYDWFFKVRDYYDTWVQKDNLLPIMSIRNVTEGKYRLYDYITFDQSRQTCANERGKAKNDIRERKSYQIDPCMHDMVSILYHARNIDFTQYKTGQSFPIKIFVDKEMWPLNVKYSGTEQGKEVRDLGTFNTLKFTPEVIPGKVFPEGAEIKVWITDDANRLPLIIESPLSVGSTKAILKSHKGLRYPLSAKVK
ncbi:MAG: DUF3108 domain-containing protein [Bacteroidetes bacterium]|nr:DUF3108 domain-containing protein [Bacteroidota bacterium]